ncbi:HGGxSTG domain-containing protein [Rhizorhabdus sp.]|uniref:HGGxSTG domain-containing protein n=1 Tax=Rhizorhabdus sp. TaxID=1968843 RepID=UPI0025E37C21|nr:HGGxSTG domain-containing protein [Rhizorhabdus sp.]
MQPAILATAPRCGARTRAGHPCRSPAVAGHQRCRMHGGRGSGAPRGNRNAYKHGLHTGWMKAVIGYVRATGPTAMARILREGGSLPPPPDIAKNKNSAHQPHAPRKSASRSQLAGPAPAAPTRIALPLRGRARFAARSAISHCAKKTSRPPKHP